MAYENAAAANYVMAGPPLKFTFGRLAGGTGASSRYPVFDYYVRIERGGVASFLGAKFPGYFRTCARNDGTEFSTVFLSVTTDQ